MVYDLVQPGSGILCRVQLSNRQNEGFLDDVVGILGADAMTSNGAPDER